MRATLHRLRPQASRICATLPKYLFAPSTSLRRFPLLTLSHHNAGNHVSPCCNARRVYGTSRDRVGDNEDASELLWSSLEESEIPSAGPTDAASASSGFTDATREASSFGGKERTAETTGGEEEVSATPAAAAAAAPVDHVWVKLHNMPRNWLHEDIIEFIHQVAQHASIAPPSASASSSSNHPSNSADAAAATASHCSENEENEDAEESMLDRVTSPFIHHLHIPFGRRTGLVYGSPKLCLSSIKLANYLTKELTFDADDFRSRIYFTKLTAAELPISFQEQQQQQQEEKRESAGTTTTTTTTGFANVRYTPIEESIQHEQDEALRTLELDRYLFAPDLLIDIAKSHQRRLVTRNEKVLLDAFLDGEEDVVDEEDEDEDEDDAVGDDSPNEEEEEEAKTENAGRRPSSSSARRRRRDAGGKKRMKKKSGQRRTRVRAGTQKYLGRGSMHNMPIPKPYVEGRQL